MWETTDLDWRCLEAEECKAAAVAFALYQGTTLVVPQRRKKDWGFSPCALSI
jgi:hypothetical protein